MVLGIAVLPLAASHWWEPNRNKLLVSIVLGLPVLVLYVVREPSALVHMAEEYVSFIVLLAALYVISGGILMRGDLLATPLVNSAFLATGSVLASFIGTTGASMLLIRALLQTNRERPRSRHGGAGGRLALVDAPRDPPRKRLHLLPDRGGRGPLLRHLPHDDPRARALATPGWRARRARALAVLLGDRRALVLSRQRPDLPDVPRAGSGPGPRA